MKRICIVVSSLMTAKAFLLDQIAALSKDNSVVVAANAIDSEALRSLGVNVPVIFVPIERRISPLRDLRALCCLVACFRQHRFDVVHSVTPKAGLLAMAAARLVRVPVRIHSFTGQVWASRRGVVRALLRATDRLIALLATHVLVDGLSQREFLVAHGVVSMAKSRVLLNSSHCSVNPKRFRPDAAARSRLRAALGVPVDAVLFLFLGRLKRDKGILDLATAFALLAARNPSAYLFVVGPDEDKLRSQIERLLAKCADRVRFMDFTDKPEDTIACADALCLPSYREGFGQVAIEAAAAGLPVIASRIYGIVDAVLEGQTGLLHPPADIEALHRHMETLLLNPRLRHVLGDAGRARALQVFSVERVTQALLDYYAEVTRKL